MHHEHTAIGDGRWFLPLHDLNHWRLVEVWPRFITLILLHWYADAQVSCRFEYAVTINLIDWWVGNVLTPPQTCCCSFFIFKLCIENPSTTVVRMVRSWGEPCRRISAMLVDIEFCQKRPRWSVHFSAADKLLPKELHCVIEGVCWYLVEAIIPLSIYRMYKYLSLVAPSAKHLIYQILFSWFPYLTYPRK